MDYLSMLKQRTKRRKINMPNRCIIQGQKELVEQVKSFYKDYEKENKGEYIAFFAKTKHVVVTIYSNKKDTDFKIVFSGESALSEAKRFDENASLSEKEVTTTKAPSKASWLTLKEQIGSDEVGTGDLFGPICVCAAYVKKSQIPFLKEIGVDDSKRLSDEQIRRIGEQLIKKIEYSQVSLDNVKYNEINDRGLNMNEMKAKMHNQVLKNLRKKHPSVQMTIIDQFCAEDTYYSYLFGEEEIVDKITFQTKAESYFPCVAAASIIARYSFLQKMDKLNQKYNVEIPFGASNKVTEFAKEFVAKHGKEELKKIVKCNFANLKEIL